MSLGMSDLMKIRFPLKIPNFLLSQLIQTPLSGCHYSLERQQLQFLVLFTLQIISWPRSKHHLLQQPNLIVRLSHQFLFLPLPSRPKTPHQKPNLILSVPQPLSPPCLFQHLPVFTHHMVTRTRDNTRKVQQFTNHLAFITTSSLEPEPKTFSQAQKHEQWMNAMHKKNRCLAQKQNIDTRSSFTRTKHCGM